MRRRHACLVAVLLLASCKRNPDRFCEAFTKASQGAATYEDALGKANGLADVEGMSGAWGSVFRTLPNLVQSQHLAMIRSEAKDLKVTFTCPAFEFPGGRPAAPPLLEDPRLGSVHSMVADDSGLYLLACSRQCSVLKWDGKALTSLAEGLDVAPRENLVAGDSAVFVATKTAIMSVAKSGGAPTPLVDGLEKVRGLSRDGASLLYVLDEHTVWRVPIAGGKPTVAVIALTFEVERVWPSGSWLVLESDSAAYVVSGQLAEKDVVQDIALQPVATRFPALAVVKGLAAVEQDDALALLDPATRELSPTGVPWSRVWPMLGSDRDLLGVDDAAQWPGKQRIVRWTPGDKAATALAAPVGAVQAFAADSKNVYWVDVWWGGLYSAKR